MHELAFASVRHWHASCKAVATEDVFGVYRRQIDPHAGGMHRITCFRKRNNKNRFWPNCTDRQKKNHSLARITIWPNRYESLEATGFFGYIHPISILLEGKESSLNWMLLLVMSVIVLAAHKRDCFDLKFFKKARLIRGSENCVVLRAWNADYFCNNLFFTFWNTIKCLYERFDIYYLIHGVRK